jgi:hypothetical protein
MAAGHQRSLLKDVRSMDGLGDGDMAAEELRDAMQRLARGNSRQRDLGR